MSLFESIGKAVELSPPKGLILKPVKSSIQLLERHIMIETYSILANVSAGITEQG